MEIPAQWKVAVEVGATVPIALPGRPISDRQCTLVYSSLLSFILAWIFV
jgi:hypothetical protein